MNSDLVPKVTACVVAHNEESTIERCLKALFDQRFGEPFSILLVDNASTDRTVEVATRIAEEKAETHPHVTFSLVRRKVNNLGAGRQTALETVTSAFIAFTDADCVVPRHWLATLFDTLVAQMKNGVVAVGSANRPPCEGSRFHGAQRLMFTSFLGHFGSEQVRTTPRALREVDHLPTCSVLYDRASLVDAGGFARAHRFVCEDVDLSYRLRARDSRLLKVDSMEVEHHARASYRAWARKIFRYGWGQVQVMRNFKEHRSAKFLLPVAFTLSFPAALLVSKPFFMIWICSYVAIIGAFSLVLSAGRIGLVTRMIPLYAITHFSYGAGLLAGVAGWSGGRGSRG